jgi:hypothetical protein
MTNEQFDEFVADLIQQKHGLNGALKHARMKINELEQGFTFKGGESMDDPNDLFESNDLHFWFDVFRELDSFIDLN